MNKVSEKKYIQARKTNTICYHMWNLKYDTNELVCKTETNRHREETSVCQGGKEMGEGWIGSLGIQTIICRMAQQQGPTV